MKFPLPNGYCRPVCRPKRKNPRRASPGLVMRAVRACLAGGIETRMICEAVIEGGLNLEKDCGCGCESFVAIYERAAALANALDALPLEKIARVFYGLAGFAAYVRRILRAVGALFRRANIVVLGLELLAELAWFVGSVAIEAERLRGVLYAYAGRAEECGGQPYQRLQPDGVIDEAVEVIAALMGSELPSLEEVMQAGPGNPLENPPTIE